MRLRHKLPALFLAAAISGLFWWSHDDASIRDPGMGTTFAVAPLVLVFFPRPFATMTGYAVGGGFMEGNLPEGLIVAFGYFLLIAVPMTYFLIT